MTIKTKKKSRILEAVYETASDFYASGLLSKEKMDEYDKLCLEPVTLYLDKDIVDYLNQKCGANPEEMRVLINDLLRKDIEIAQRVAL